MEPKWIVGIVAGVVVLLSLPLVLANKVTMSNYNEVKMGMTYEQVKDILGSGKTIDEVDPPKIKKSDLPPGMPMPTQAQIKQAQAAMKQQMQAMNMTVYVWQRGDEKAISVMLQNGKVVGKTQAGLAEQPSAQFDGIGDGDMPIPGFPGMPATGFQ